MVEESNFDKFTSRYNVVLEILQKLDCFEREVRQSLHGVLFESSSDQWYNIVDLLNYEQRDEM